MSLYPDDGSEVEALSGSKKDRKADESIVVKR
jgi:hypothetical protein